MKKKTFSFLCFVLVAMSVFFYKFFLIAHAAPVVNELSNPLTSGGQALTVSNVSARMIKLSLGAISFASLLMFMYGGFKYMFATNAKGTNDSLKIMYTSVAGVAIAFLAYSIINTVFKVIVF